jgi:FMN-dependent NADH-azoreductase
MNTVLYLKASPRIGCSHSIAVADAFVESYRKTHPADQIKTIDLFEKPLPAFDLAATTAKYKIMEGQEHSEQDCRIWAEILAVIDEFKSADKYVMAVPMWNFSIPYRLKQYIDIIVQPGLTFTVTDGGGYEGLVKDKSVFIVYARGGDYPQGSGAESFDLQKKYLELILNFIGLADIRSVVVGPTLAAGPDVAKRKRAEAVQKAKQMADDF